MGFKPRTSIKKKFRLIKYKKRALKIQAMMGFKPMTNIYHLLKYQRRKRMKY